LPRLADLPAGDCATAQGGTLDRNTAVRVEETVTSVGGTSKAFGVYATDTFSPNSLSDGDEFIG
jgi:hypothetical protein